MSPSGDVAVIVRSQLDHRRFTGGRAVGAYDRRARSAMTRPLSRIPAGVLLGAALAVLGGGCGGAGHGAATTATTTYRGFAIAGTSASAQAVADAAAQKPTGAGVRSELSPLPATAFDGPVARYRAYAGRQADAMAGAVARLAAALRRGDRAGAQAAWLAAYARYLRLGAAYGALGALDTAIDGTPGHLAGGVRDPRFSGLHRIEHGLWGGAPLATLLPWTARLAGDVGRLRHVVRSVAIDPLAYATRAHEILEDAQRDMLSGQAAPWSGAGVLATAASLDATEAVIGTLRPLLDGRGEALAPVQTQMAALARVLAAVRRAHGGAWPPLDALTRAEHERIDGALGALLEALAAVPGSLETTMTPTIPTIAEQAR